MTEAEKITQEMMAAYSTSIRFGLDTVEEFKPIIFDPPRTEQGTINETRRAQALRRSMDRRPPFTSVLGSSVTDDPTMGIRTVVGNRGLTRFYNTTEGQLAYEDKSFPGGIRSAKFQGIGYRLGQQLENFPKGKVLSSSPMGDIRSYLYNKKSAGAITPEFPNDPIQGYKTRTLKNRGVTSNLSVKVSLVNLSLLTRCMEQLKVVLFVLQRLIPQSFDLVVPIESQDRSCRALASLPMSPLP